QPTAEAAPAPAETAKPAGPTEAAPPAAPVEAAPAPAEAAKPTVAAEGPLPDMAIGNADAPVTIIEYSSLGCPHCAHFHADVFPELKSQYIDTGKVRYVMREFPLNEPSLAGAVIARCLDPSRYFAFTSLLFSKQPDWAFKEDSLTPLKAYAK